MKRAELRKLGLTKQDIAIIMKMHGKAMVRYSKKLITEKPKESKLKRQLSNNQRELAGLKARVRAHEVAVKEVKQFLTDFVQLQKD